MERKTVAKFFIRFKFRLKIEKRRARSDPLQYDFLVVHNVIHNGCHFKVWCMHQVHLSIHTNTPRTGHTSYIMTIYRESVFYCVRMHSIYPLPISSLNAVHFLCYVFFRVFFFFFSLCSAVSMHYGIDLPREGPHISGEQSQYQIGDTLNINCTSGKSHPSSSIQWFINDEPVSCLFNTQYHRHLPCVPWCRRFECNRNTINSHHVFMIFPWVFRCRFKTLFFCFNHSFGLYLRSRLYLNRMSFFFFWLILHAIKRHVLIDTCIRLICVLYVRWYRSGVWFISDSVSSDCASARFGDYGDGSEYAIG